MKKILRNREQNLDPKLLLVKLLPLIFILLIILATSTLGFAAAGDGITGAGLC